MKINIISAAVIGFAAGLVPPVVYLATGGETGFWAPRWAVTVFFPGFVAGSWAYGQIGSRYYVPEVAGCLAMATTYAIIFGLLFVASRRWSRGRLPKPNKITGANHGQQ